MAYVLGSDDYVYRNTFKDIRYILETMGGEGSKFEHECYDVGHLYNLAYFVDQGLVKAPFFIQFIFGVMGGIGPDLDNLMFMKRTADRLFGAESYHWSVLGGQVSDAVHYAGGPDGRKCARWAGGQSFH